MYSATLESGSISRSDALASATETRPGKGNECNECFGVHVMSLVVAIKLSAFTSHSWWETPSGTRAPTTRRQRGEGSLASLHPFEAVSVRIVTFTYLLTLLPPRPSSTHLRTPSLTHDYGPLSNKLGQPSLGGCRQLQHLPGRIPHWQRPSQRS
jgi:hypothetical protein